jgi:peptidoglycan hydrolase CwlO-like protein
MPRPSESTLRYTFIGCVVLCIVGVILLQNSWLTTPDGKQPTWASLLINPAFLQMQAQQTNQTELLKNLHHQGKDLRQEIEWMQEQIQELAKQAEVEGAVNQAMKSDLAQTRTKLETALESKRNQRSLR